MRIKLSPQYERMRQYKTYFLVLIMLRLYHSKDVPRVPARSGYEFVWRQLIGPNATSEDHGNVARRD